MPSCDVVVAGCGAVGSAALYHLAKTGFDVIGLDRFPPAHDRGSSHGETRVIRQAYFEHPDYVPLLQRAYQLWESLAAESDEQLYQQTGVLQIGSEHGEIVPGVLESARVHDLPIHQLNSAELASDYPGFVLPDGYQAILEERGGYLRVEDSIRAYTRLAQSAGAKRISGETILNWTATESGVTIKTDQQTYRAAALILATGAWAAELMPDLANRFAVLRKHLYWYANDNPDYRQDHGCPVFFYELGDRCFYGFPQVDPYGVKVSEHTGGKSVADPLTVSRAIDPQDRSGNEAFLASHLPGVTDRMTRHEVCMYTMSPDGHFIVDQWPGYGNVVFAAGLSGHGFKFASVLGETLARQVTGEQTLNIDFLRLDRLGGTTDNSLPANDQNQD